MVGKLDFEITKDSMIARATVSMALSKQEEAEITEEYILKKMEEKGIKAGILPNKVKQLVEESLFNKSYVVAEGKYAGKGTEGHYEFLFDENKDQNKPVIRPDGSIDYSTQRELTTEGAKIAIYYPAVQGTFGYTIFATVIGPVPVKDLPALHLKGVEKRENEYYATTNGQILYSQYRNELHVINELEVNGNCGYGTGDINFSGDVHIKGDVMSGVRIYADGNIVIDGVVEGAYIEAGKSIILRNGVHGMEKAKIIAGDSVIANFIDQAQVEAVESIIADSIINCNCYTKGTVCATGKNGMILGGHTRSERSIEANYISNEQGVKTQISLVPQEDEEEEGCKLIVHNFAYDGANIKINGKDLLHGHFTKGELHLMPEGMKVFDIGHYVPTPRPKKELKKKNEKKMILIVDDEPIILKTFFGFLHDKYTVAAVNSAKDAFAFMEKAIPDLILLDYMMPNMNGGEMLKRMRKNILEPCYKVPVYFVTSVIDKDVVLECLAMYPQGYLIKPLGKDELLQVVDTFFESLDKEEAEKEE